MRKAVIIGAGIVGLATAYYLRKKYPDCEISILEKEAECATHQTGRNSGVVHSGVYYTPGSLKAQYCVEGRKALLNFCDEWKIPYRQMHKLIVATKEDALSQLETLKKNGLANGLHGLEILDSEEIKDWEPNVCALKGLFIPECHILDFRMVAEVLCEHFQASGIRVLFNQTVQFVDKEDARWYIQTQDQVMRSDLLINCAGLHADRIAKSDVKIIPFRGEYYQLLNDDLVKGLVYPAPDPKLPFLGVHINPTIDGRFEVGPNAVLALAREGYEKECNYTDCWDFLSYPGFWKMALRYWKEGIYELYRSKSKKAFLKSVQELVPNVQEKDLQPLKCGIRAQAVKRDGTLLHDFCLKLDENRIDVVNAPSPAATSSFAIAKNIVERIASREYTQFS